MDIMELKRQVDVLNVLTQEIIDETIAAAPPAKPQIKTKIIGDLEWQDELVPEMSWDKAVEYAKSLGDGWRLPTVEVQVVNTKLLVEI